MPFDHPLGGEKLRGGWEDEGSVPLRFALFSVLATSPWAEAVECSFPIAQSLKAPSFFYCLKENIVGNIPVSLPFFFLINSNWSCLKFKNDRPYQVLARPLRHPPRCALCLSLSFPRHCVCSRRCRDDKARRGTRTVRQRGEQTALVHPTKGRFLKNKCL